MSVFSPPAEWYEPPDEDCSHWRDRDVVLDDGSTAYLCLDCGEISPAE